MVIYNGPLTHFYSSGDEPRAHTPAQTLPNGQQLVCAESYHNSHTLLSMRADHRQFVQEESSEQGNAQREGHGGFMERRSQSRETPDVAAS